MFYLNTQAPYDSFQELLNEEVFVDKTLMINRVAKHINRTNHYICITKPRRFGKSLNASMLAAYFGNAFNSEELFGKCKIAQTDQYGVHMNKYNIVYIEFNRVSDYCNSYEDYIKNITAKLKRDLIQKYPHLADWDYPSVSDMFIDTDEKFIFILDEWDAIFYKDFMHDKEKERYLRFLENLLKGQNYVKLAYMTGVLPIISYTSGSALNMFDEYSFLNDNIYGDYFGFTDAEVRELCDKFPQPSYEEITKWYNGYTDYYGNRIFNSRSVNLAFVRGVCENYWTETGPMNEIAECIEHNVDAVRSDIVELASGNTVRIKLLGNSAANFRLSTRNEILSAMVIYGFLSYSNLTLRVPNYELMQKYTQVLQRESMGQVQEIVSRSEQVLNATLNEDCETVAEILEYIHDTEIPFLQYNDENSLSCVITLAYLYARDFYYITREAKGGKGYCDYLMQPLFPDMPAIILELKIDGSCDEAIQQIKDRKYIQAVKNTNAVLYVGINYDKKLKQHTCKIERAELP